MGNEHDVGPLRWPMASDLKTSTHSSGQLALPGRIWPMLSLDYKGWTVVVLVVGKETRRNLNDGDASGHRSPFGGAIKVLPSPHPPTAGVRGENPNFVEQRRCHGRGYFPGCTAFGSYRGFWAMLSRFVLGISPPALRVLSGGAHPRAWVRGEGFPSTGHNSLACSKRELKLLPMVPKLQHQCSLLPLNDIALSSLALKARGFLLSCSGPVNVSNGVVYVCLI